MLPGPVAEYGKSAVPWGVYRGSANYIMITRRRSINVTEIIMVVSDKRHI